MFIDEFVNYLAFEKRYSKHTITSYKNDLLQFLGFLEQQYETSEIQLANHLQVRSWIVHMVQNDISNKSVNRKISTLKSFYKYHIKRGKIKRNPMQRIVTPKLNKRLPVYVREDRIKTLLESDSFPPDFSGLRDLLILEIFYQTGIRRSELISIKDLDFNKSAGILKVLGKGNKERLIPIRPKLFELVNDYKKSRDEQFDQTDFKTLLVTDKGLPLYPKYVYNKVTAYLALITTNDKKSPHILRHSFATHLANRGAELNAIKSLLGHSSLAATQIYTHNTIEKLKKAHSKAHPKS